MPDERVQIYEKADGTILIMIDGKLRVRAESARELAEKVGTFLLTMDQFAST